MPISQTDLEARPTSPAPLTELPFPPVTKSHILNCSFHSWYPRYRSLTPKTRLIPLSQPFLEYLRADGIRLPPEAHPQGDHSSSDTASDEDEDEDVEDPSQAWKDIHEKIESTITELNGSVMPKLNWSAPKDATWIATTNSMECRSPNDIYLLLKSSDFVTHDLEQVFDDCEDDDADEDSASNSTSDDEEEELNDHPSKQTSLSKIPYHLIIRKTVPNFNPSLEFRCFTRSRHLLCICQRDLNHFTFLPPLLSHLRSQIQAFFSQNLQHTFPDSNFVFDVYIPPPHQRVWLIDINPWAPRTDPLLFSWLEILNMRGSEHFEPATSPPSNTFMRLYLNPTNPLTLNAPSTSSTNPDNQTNPITPPTSLSSDSSSDDDDDEDRAIADDDLEIVFTPEFRLVNRDDPEAYRFNTPQYSAHKLPRDVVDASADGEAGLREFMGTWREIVARQEREEGKEG